MGDMKCKINSEGKEVSVLNYQSLSHTLLNHHATQLKWPIMQFHADVSILVSFQYMQIQVTITLKALDIQTS